jgi:predicted membrane protein (TIGR00267 family)
MREIVFGLEDSFVSTLGAVTGIAAGTQDKYVVILSGLVLVAVESISMAAGSYLSSKSSMEAEEAVLKEEGKGGGVPAVREHPVRSAFVMGAFYLAGGMVPVAPYFFLPVGSAYGPSVVATGICLFGLGAWSASFAKRSPWRGGAEMALVSLGAAAVGFAIGRAVSAWY